MSNSVIAAIDLGPSTSRVLYHAAGFARLLETRLCVLHVSRHSATADRQRVLDFCARSGPYEIDFGEKDTFTCSGTVSDAIYRLARSECASLVVMGSRGHGPIMSFLLGSTAKAVLRDAPSPVLLVPPVDFDIVNITDHPTMTCGPVLAAVDLGESSRHQLHFAAKVAEIAGQPLLLMTVAPQRIAGHVAATLVRERARDVTGITARAVIVRRGNVPEEISRCAVAEGAGLVVMGLRGGARGRPGAIATAVLKTGRAFVLAVPGR